MPLLLSMLLVVFTLMHMVVHAVPIPAGTWTACPRNGQIQYADLRQR